MHGTGVILKENSISRAYEQLNYTNCIKKFLLSQPRSFSSDSDVKKSSSEEGFDEEMTSNILSDSDFDFDISVPKPPSFGSSTRVLVSEQEHRDNEPLLDHMTLRDQLHLPSALVDTNLQPSPQIPRETHITTDSPPIMNLTRESLWKHTILQEQLYIATASPERSILFVNEQRDMNCQSGQRQRHSLKRSHSPDHSSMDRRKTGRRSTDSPQLPTTRSILNPIFPIISCETQHAEIGISRNPSLGARMMVPMQMFPIVSIQSSTNTAMDAQSQITVPSNMIPCSTDQIAGMTFKPRVMVGFHQSMHGQPQMPVGLPLPVHQLNSFVMQQAMSMVPKTVVSKPSRMKQVISKGHPISSSESSSTEETGLSFYLLESSENKIKLAYNHLVMQSLARQLSPTRGLEPAPWLQKVPFPDGLKYRYHLYRSKNKRQLKKDREELEKVTQPDMLMNQFEEMLANISLCCAPIRDQESEYLFFNEPETGDRTCCSCMHDTCCKELPYNDHGISDAMKALRKHTKKNDKRVKKSQHSSCHQNVSVQTNEDFAKMDVDSDPGGNSLTETEPHETLEKSKTESCSSKSDSGDGDIRCYMSSDSINSSNNSDLTPSDQRSNNENGSSLKESDGDAMSKKSDSCASDKQLVSSESESETKNKTSEDSFSRLFTSSDICFPHLHRECAPWLLDVEFNDDIKMKYYLETRDAESVLMNDKSQLDDLDEPDLVKDQLSALMEELGDSNLELVSIMSSGDPGTNDIEESETSGHGGTSDRM